MRKVKIKHKDGDMTGITMIYIFYLQIKKHKELWEIDVEEYALNRYYKGVLTRIIKTTEILVHRFENYINHTVINDVLTVLEREFKECMAPSKRFLVFHACYKGIIKRILCKVYFYRKKPRKNCRGFFCMVN